MPAVSKISMASDAKVGRIDGAAAASMINHEQLEAVGWLVLGDRRKWGGVAGDPACGPDGCHDGFE